MVPFGGFIEPWIASLSKNVREEHRRRRSVALRAAEVRTGLSREDLEEQIASDPDLLPLAIRVLFAAGQGGDDSFRQLLGAALGDAVSGGGGAEEALLIVGPLESLRPTLLRILELLATKPPGPPGFEGAEDPQGFWLRDHVRQRLGISEEALGLCLSELASRGTIAVGQTYAGDDCELTALGRTILDVMGSLKST